MTGTKIVRVSTANIIPPMLVPRENNTLEDMWVPSEANSDRQDSQVSMGISLKISKSSVVYYPNHKREELTLAQTKKLLKKLNLSGIEEWPKEDQESVKSLIKEFGLIFALDDLDLGKTSITKHRIKLMGEVLFKERYRCIPPTPV